MRFDSTAGRVMNREHAGSSSEFLAAIERGDADEVRRLLNGGADAKLEIETPIRDGVHRTTPLATAARAGHSAIVRLLLERGARPAGGSGHSVLVGLALEGFYEPEVVRLLVEAGADPSEQDQETGLDILHAVARAGDLDTLRFLLGRGVEVGASHLGSAAESGHPEVFLAIADCPVRREGERVFAAIAHDPSAPESPPPFRALLADDTIRDAQPKLLRAFLGIRDRFSDAEARLESLIAAGALRGGEHEPLPPLHVLVTPLANPVGPRAETEDVRLARVLLDAGEPVDAQFPYGNSPDFGATPMMRAAGFGRAELVSFFLERGAEPRAKDADGRGAAAYADRAASLELTAQLVAAGAEPQRWVDVARASQGAVKNEAVNSHGLEHDRLMMKIGCVAFAVAGLIGVFFWLLARFG